MALVVEEALGKLTDFEQRADPNDASAQSLLEEMRSHIRKVCAWL